MQFTGSPNLISSYKARSFELMKGGYQADVRWTLINCVELGEYIKATRREWTKQVVVGGGGPRGLSRVFQPASQPPNPGAFGWRHHPWATAERIVAISRRVRGRDIRFGGCFWEGRWSTDLPGFDNGRWLLCTRPPRCCSMAETSSTRDRSEAIS